MPVIQAVTKFDPFGPYLGPHVPMTWMAPIGDLIDEAIAEHTGQKFYWLSAPRNHGKALHENSPVLTPSGWVPIKNLKVGKSVIGSDGKPCEVTGVFPQGELQLYTVEFSDGTSVECCAEHLWYTRTYKEKCRKDSVGSVKTLGEILEYFEPSDHEVFAAGGIEFEPRGEPLLHPYVMGALLGDGCLRNNTISFNKPESDVCQKIARLLPEGDSFNGDISKGYNVVGYEQTRDKPSKTRRILEGYEVYRTNSQSKFIPDVYKFASVEDRKHLLVGLIDTDGHVVKEGTAIEWCTTSPRMYEDFLFVARSLGLLVIEWSSKIGAYKKNGEAHECARAYRCGIRLASGGAWLPPMLSSKHQARVIQPKKDARKAISRITPSRVAPAVCISVSDPLKQFVTSGFVLTHNSILINTAIMKHLAAHPQKAIGLFTNKEGAALARSRMIRRACDKLGWRRRRDADKQEEFEFVTGSKVKVGTVLTVTHGDRFRLVIIDDPYADVGAAKTQSIRERVLEAIENDVMPTLDPDGSLILIHARQHVDDAIGHFRRLSNKKTFSFGDNVEAAGRVWKGVNLQALYTEDGEEKAIWPERFPVSTLKEIRRENPIGFVTQYQGDPRTVEGTLFHEPSRYKLKDLPTEYRKAAYGVDLAFSGRSSNRGDWSVMLRMIRVQHNGPLVIDPETNRPFNYDKYYITDVIRYQETAPDFAKRMLRQMNSKPANMLWHCAPGPEKGNSDFIRLLIPALNIQYATVDKYAWAMPLSKAWNSGRVFVPDREDRPIDAPDHWTDGLDWVDAFVDEMMSFTGDKSDIDDQVDAAASAFNLLQHNVSHKAVGAEATHSRMF